MSLDKYYESLFIDEKINSHYVTYLSYIHIFNSLARRDKVTNKVLKDLGRNYSKKALELYQDANSPLVYTNDDIQNIYNYTLPHIENILSNPHKSIIKEQKLVRTNKLKTVEPKTLIWLSSKPGSTIKEKLGNVEKVSSTIKRFTFNIKENQILFAFYKDISRLMYSKIEVTKKYSNLFGQNESNIQIDNTLRRLNKIRYAFKNELKEVIEKDYSTPNNALLGNVDYSSVWNSYLSLKQNQINYEDSFNKYISILKSFLIYYLMNQYDFIEEYENVQDAYKHILYKIENSRYSEFIFNFTNGIELTINRYDLYPTTKIISSDHYEVSFIETDSDSERGILFNLFINGKLIHSFHADILGAKETIDAMLSYLGLASANKPEAKNEKVPFLFSSIHSYDNRIFSENTSALCTYSFDDMVFENNQLTYANRNNIYLNSFTNSKYYDSLKLLSNKQDFSMNGYLIYDIVDNFDEFSSANLRRIYSSIYPQSYPVWRSILAGESIENKERIPTVLDFCGRDFCISKLERKNNKFVHCGPIEVPIYYQIVNEQKCYEIYISEYENKYNISYPKDVVDEMILSGGLHAVLSKLKEHHLSITGDFETHEVYSIGFDNECFMKMYEEFKLAMNAILNKYPINDTIAIIPDFLKELSTDTIITNNSLLLGAKTIIERLKKHEVTWYEKIPRLSLEIIKNGVYDDLLLVDNQECENIIGKKINIYVPEKLTLSKGQKNYILPLNKSFIGEQNETFVAKASDPSFPLKEDTDVKLILEYSFGAENSYNLCFVPLDNNAPFKKIDIVWEKENNATELIYPEIKNRYTNSNHEENFQAFSSTCEYINRCCDLLRNRKFMGDNKKIYKAIRLNTYRHEKLITCNFDLSAINRILNETNYKSNLRYLHALMEYNYEKETNDHYKEIALWNLEDIECAMVECFRKDNFFDKNYLKFPEACYGTYFTYKKLDNKIISQAFNSLIKLSEANNYLSSKKLRIHFQRLTGATTNDYHIPYNLSKINSSYVRYLLKVIIKIMREMAEYDYTLNPDDKNNNPKENAMLMRYCIEILISYLFVRELPEFEDLKPSGTLSKELIHYLKVFNRKYVRITDWIERFNKEPNMKCKYNISYEGQPEELSKMLPEIYCLILYLSGDSRANLIKIKVGDQDARIGI